MKQIILPLAAAAMLLSSLPATARQGAPHTYRVRPTYSSVALSWQSPESAKELRWHDNSDYDGDAGVATSTQRPACLYVAADFAPEDLVPGETIVSLNYFEYRPVVSLTALIYEDGVLVREQPGSLAGYKANQWRTVAFDRPYTIPEGKSLRIGFRIEHGTNMDFVAIMDRNPNPKADLISYDGRTWRHNGRGSYLITANLANDVDEAPTGFNVYVDDVKVTGEALPPSAVAYDLAGQTDGTHRYRVEALYGAASHSVERSASVLGAASYFPAPSAFAATVDGMQTGLKWSAPLLRGSDNRLSWTTGTLGTSIGGTASSNTKVWVKNEFEASDLLSFAGARITAIRAHFQEKETISMILFVQRDGAFIQYDTVPAEAIAAIAAGQWSTFPLSQPVTIEPGHKYAYGYYMTHTPKKHPVSVDNGAAVGAKGNSFSTSSPNSSNFANSRPTWKTLASGDIAGNWMMTAELQAADPYGATTAAYNVYRDGVRIAGPLTALEYADPAPAPGTYTYAVEAIGSNGNPSETLTAKAVVKLPSEYRSPLISNAQYDAATQSVSFDWGMDVEIAHHGDAAYKAGFDEEMTLSWGARFSAADLAPYAGYSISKLNFSVGAEIPGGFKLQVHNNAGTLLASADIAPGAVTPLGLYSLTLDSLIPVVPADGLILSYSATLPGSCPAMVLDAGPLVQGGAVVRLAGALNWMNLGTINSTYNNYNIVIGAIASEPAAGAPEAVIGCTGEAADMPALILPASDWGIERGEQLPADEQPATAPARAASVSGFTVYRDGEPVATTEGRHFSEQLPAYDTYSYTVSATYANGWESNHSEALVVANTIPQAPPAPYGLHMPANGVLAWQAPEEAPVLTYSTDDGLSYGVGMTGSGTRNSYIVNKFPADSLAAVAGHRVTHIRFGLYTTEVNSASVVIFRDLNLVYEQEIPLSELKAIQTDGYNTVRLNQPYLLEAGHDIMIGYHLTYANGIKPMLFDAGPADNGLGNLLSATGSHTSWKSLKSLNSSLDGNWRLYATLAAPDSLTTRSARRADPAITYNVYRNGIRLLEGLTATTATPDWLPAPQANLFTVTAVKDGVESAPSNAVGNESSGVGTTAAEPVAETYYDLQGVQLESRPATGTLCIIRTVWSDGSVTTERRMAR